MFDHDNAGAERYPRCRCMEGSNSTLGISVPIGFAPWRLRRKHPELAVWLPASSAGLANRVGSCSIRPGMLLNP